MSRTKFTEKEYPLTRASVDAISNDAQEFCKTLKYDRRELIRLGLSVEECVLSWVEAGKESDIVRITYGKSLAQPYISLESNVGRSINPYEAKSKSRGSYSTELLVHMGMTPEYTYKKGWNQLIFRLQKHTINPLITLFGVIIAALVFGVGGIVALPNATLTAILDNFITPVYETFFTVLGCIASPMIFFSVAWGIYGIGDVASIGKVGSRILIRFFGFILLFCALASLVYPLLGPELGTSSTGSSPFEAVFELILGIFPGDIFSPFVEGNTLQIIFLAFCVGLVLVYLGRQTAAVAKAIEQINYLIQFLAKAISAIVPFFIFFVLVQLIWSKSFEIALSIGGFLVITALTFIAMCIITTIYMDIKYKVPVFTLFKKALNTFIITITTASSAAAFGSLMENCEKNLGIDGSVTSFGIPISIVLFKPSTAIYYLFICFYFAAQYDVSTSITWIMTAVILCAIVAVATPPIPGGSTIAYTLLFAQLGLPAEALGLVIAIDILVDFLMTTTDLYLGPLIIADTAHGINKLDVEKLRAPYDFKLNKGK